MKKKKHAWWLSKIPEMEIMSSAIFLGVVANVQKYTKSYATVARGTTRESAGNDFCCKSLSEKHKSLKTLQSENRERGERPMRAT